MITQKQIDTRDEYIKELETIAEDYLYVASAILRRYAYRLLAAKAISDADKEAAGMKDEMLDAARNWHVNRRSNKSMGGTE